MCQCSPFLHPSRKEASRPWANISQSCAELCLHATRRKPTHSVGCWIGVRLLRALTFACLWLNTTVGALNLIVSSESAIYVANPSTSLDHEGSESTSLSIWGMSEEDRWDGVSYVDIPKKTSGFVWMCHRWCSNPHSDTNFIPRWMSFWKSSGELDVKFIRYRWGHLCIDDILRRDKVISQPKMSARIANIIVVRCTIQYSVILVSSCRGS